MAKAVDVAITLQEIAVYPKIARPTACKLAQEGRIPGRWASMAVPQGRHRPPACQ